MHTVLSQRGLELTAMEGENKRMRLPMNVARRDIEEKCSLGRENVFDVPLRWLRGQNELRRPHEAHDNQHELNEYDHV